MLAETDRRGLHESRRRHHPHAAWSVRGSVWGSARMSSEVDGVPSASFNRFGGDSPELLQGAGVRGARSQLGTLADINLDDLFDGAGPRRRKSPTGRACVGHRRHARLDCHAADPGPTNNRAPFDTRCNAGAGSPPGAPGPPAAGPSTVANDHRRHSQMQPVQTDRCARHRDMVTPPPSTNSRVRPRDCSAATACARCSVASSRTRSLTASTDILRPARSLGPPSAHRTAIVWVPARH